MAPSMKSSFGKLQILKIYAYSISGVLFLILSLFAFSVLMAKTKGSVPDREELLTISGPVDTLALVQVPDIGPMGLFRLQGDSANYRISGMPYALLDTLRFSQIAQGDTIEVYYRIYNSKKGTLFKELIYWLNFRDVWELKYRGGNLLSYSLVKGQMDVFNKQFLRWLWPLFFAFIAITLFFAFLTLRILRSR